MRLYSIVAMAGLGAWNSENGIEQIAARSPANPAVLQERTVNGSSPGRRYCRQSAAVRMISRKSPLPEIRSGRGAGGTESPDGNVPLVRSTCEIVTAETAGTVSAIPRAKEAPSDEAGYRAPSQRGSTRRRDLGWHQTWQAGLRTRKSLNPPNMDIKPNKNGNALAGSGKFTAAWAAVATSPK